MSTFDRPPSKPPRRALGRLIALALGALMLAGGADAEAAWPAAAGAAPDPVASLLDQAVSRSARPSRISLADRAVDGLGGAGEDGEPLLPPGVARTSVDHRFGHAGPVGSAGFLCGLQPGLKDSAAGRTGSYDAQGKFLGARLSLPFR